MVNVAVLGYGTVGSGVFEVISTNQEIINKNAGEEVNVKYVLDLRDFPGDPVEKVLVHDFDTILKDDEVRIVIEVMGGTGAAYKFVKESLLAGKSVCTSNKALVAAYGPELMQIARDKNVNFLFEASVGGGIPVIRPLETSITADRIEAVMGILNGTTNYILTQMADEGWDFDKALKKAQELGYAEANPEADIEGYDTCRKIAILTSLVTGKNVEFEDIYTDGITKITATDILYAKKMGRAIKLLASSTAIGDNTYVMVAPFLVASDNPLYGVNGVFNAVFIRGNVLGDIMLYGSGAGKLPTASAVVSDVVEAVRSLDHNVGNGWSADKMELSSLDGASREFFVRFNGKSEEMIADIEAAFGEVSIIKIEEDPDGFAVITGRMTEKAFADRLSELKGVAGRIRIEG